MNPPKKFVSYFRVSTNHQGLNGLGMDAQKETVKRYVQSTPGEIISEFSEVETGKRRDRPELLKALDLCRHSGATLLIAKLDRLARNAGFLLGLRDSGVEFVACDMPTANRLTVGILAVVAEHEREMISQRTKEGLAAAKRRGTRLGNPNYAGALEAARNKRRQNSSEFCTRVMPVIKQIKAAKVTSYRGIAKCLNARGIKTQFGCRFGAQAVKNLLGGKTGERPLTSGC